MGPAGFLTSVMGSSGCAAAPGLSHCLVISGVLQTLGCFVNWLGNSGEYDRFGEKGWGAGGGGGGQMIYNT